MAKGKVGTTRQIHERLDAVEKMLLMLMSNAQIFDHMKRTYDIGERQSAKYIATVLRKWEIESKEESPHRRTKLRRTTETIVRMSLKEKAFAPAVRAVEMLAKFDGLMEPERHAVVVEHVPTPELESHSTEELRALRDYRAARDARIKRDKDREGSGSTG